MTELFENYLQRAIDNIENGGIILAIPSISLGAEAGGHNSAIQTTHPYFIDGDFFVASGSASYLAKVDPGGVVVDSMRLTTVNVPVGYGAIYVSMIQNIAVTERLELSGSTVDLDADDTYIPILTEVGGVSIGTDLVFDGDVSVTSTAGGVFHVTVSFLHSND